MAKNTIVVCSIDGCLNSPRAKGLCGKHYQANRETVPCSVPQCERKSQAKGLCPMHYQRYRQDLGYQCSFTGCEATEGIFRYRCPEHTGIRDVEKLKANQQRWREGMGRDKWLEWNRKNNLKRNYGITYGDVEAQLEAQGGVCAICGSSEPNARWDSFAVDHDHETGELRGLLCGKCNTGIGQFNDDISRLRSAIAYLQHGGVWNDTKPVERKVG